MNKCPSMVIFFRKREKRSSSLLRFIVFFGSIMNYFIMIIFLVLVNLPECIL